MVTKGKSGRDLFVCRETGRAKNSAGSGKASRIDIVEECGDRWLCSICCHSGRIQGPAYRWMQVLAGNRAMNDA